MGPTSVIAHVSFQTYTESSSAAVSAYIFSRPTRTKPKKLQPYYFKIHPPMATMPQGIVVEATTQSSPSQLLMSSKTTNRPRHTNEKVCQGSKVDLVRQEPRGHPLTTEPLSYRVREPTTAQGTVGGRAYVYTCHR